MIIDIVLGYAEGRGGLESVLTAVSQGLSRRGHRVRVFQAIQPMYLEWEDTLPEIYYYTLGRNFNDKNAVFEYALGYQEMLSMLGLPDIILATHTPLFSYVCKLALSYLGENNISPILSWLHGPPESFGGGEYLKYADGHLAISKAIGEKILNYDKNKSIFYIGNPVALNSFDIIKRPRNKLKIIFVGRINNIEKRIDILFNALKDLCGDWNLELIGDGQDRLALECMAENLGISNNIHWLGWKERPWNEIKEASLLVISSDYEGFGLVIVEALARGVPVVSTACDGPTDIIVEGKNGWLFPIGNSQALSEILQNILDNKIILPDAQTCIESVKKFSPEKVVDKIERILLSFIASKESPVLL